MVNPPCSNVRVIIVIFGVRNVWNFTVIPAPREQVPVGKHLGGVLKITLMEMTNLVFVISALLVTVYDVSPVDCTVTCFD